MYGIKLGLGALHGCELSVAEQIRLFHKIGFEAFFTGFDDHTAEYRRVADECGMIYQSIHAPFDKSALMWEDTDTAREAREELIACAERCAEYSVPIMVIHAYIGFDDKSRGQGSEFYRNGIKNYEAVVLRARELGVKIAIENTEGEEYLGALLGSFRKYDNVGFCWDTGHEMCYNFGKDMTALYGDRLIATHVNDNLGIRDFCGKITWHDDLHLLPFDGITDFDSVAKRLATVGCPDVLTFELSRMNKPERLNNEKYKRMSAEEYLTEAYARACRVAALVKRYEGK